MRMNDECHENRSCRCDSGRVGRSGLQGARAGRAAAGRGLCRPGGRPGCADLPRPGGPDGGLPGRGHQGPRRRLSRDGELPRRLVRAHGASCSTRSTGSRSRPFSRRARRIWRRSQARLAKAENDVSRYTPLVAKQAVSKQELDNALSERDAARSQVEAGRAAVEKATLDLSYTRITSPIAGLAARPT